ncbi:cytochrome d ubiquinol oxidase subunit II [Psychrobium sp. 1_MG-2023]|uniref:cytochrome d ubiquinol oxidase subunit II n=1 Tax=Psychrobium sp. 1_MG-2023 TaxID=3062624 RepID=UPI000C32E588|nr:cytochrome d ubiquinol oxidase subunit II [Psychrobium sp. 1_MG-2023]MDP2561364.1 cytochrome d ubiquinol oxidase subunit II [Psychrobium sp. 1_MG-2023]PKF54845.1 cytochrome d ubiquinol oxidase subunit II [Alteromonadales bacterium alter-6D02]
MFEQTTLAVVFVGLMGLSVLLYAILDGYDLGVGMLLPLKNDSECDSMIASIGPFWDANETWLVMAVGLLLIAFPLAHSIVFKALYLPTLLLLISLIMRGIAFDFRVKAPFSHKPTWNLMFKLGSLLAALSQGYMLGMYIMGFEQSVAAVLFSLLSALGVTAAYCLIGAAWLVMKTEHTLQRKAINWTKKSLIGCFIGVVAVSFINPLVNPDVFKTWLSNDNAWLILPLPILCFALFVIGFRKIKQLSELTHDDHCWQPFVITVAIFTLCFSGLAISFFPYIVPGQLTIWQAVAAPEALNFILWGAIIVIPTIIGYTIFSYRVFWGKVTELTYY